MFNEFLLSCKEIEKLTTMQRSEYYEQLETYCLNSGGNRRNKFFSHVINIIAPKLRGYDFEIVGRENLPSNNKILFVANHSNTHDFFTTQEMFKALGIKGTFLASNEDLNSIILSVFKSCGGVLMDRNDKESINHAIIEFAANIIHGMPGLIFAESTWNLHPFKPMHLLKPGAAMIAAITEAPIVPTIFEYIEVPRCCGKEEDIYAKCIVKFCPTINIMRDENLFSQTEKIQSALEDNRMDLWKQLGINRLSLQDINQEIYLNHTYLKKFCGAGEYIYI